MKKLLIVLIVVSLFVLTGCEDNEETKKTEIISNGEKVNTAKMEHKHCERQGTLEGGEVSLQYEIYYTGEVLNLVKSEEKVISPNEEILDKYEEAYRGIHSHYTDLEYYDTEVIRGETAVTSLITINYDKIDIQQLLDIEGSEHNVVENGIPKVDKWLELAKKFGTKCTKVEE